MHDINDKVKAMLEEKDVKYRHHIGGAWYVSVTTRYTYRRHYYEESKRNNAHKIYS